MFVPHPLPQVDAHGLVVRSTPAPLPEGPSTVSACLETGCRNHPDRPALVWNDHTLTYSDLDVRVEAAAGGCLHPDIQVRVGEGVVVPHEGGAIRVVTTPGLQTGGDRGRPLGEGGRCGAHDQAVGVHLWKRMWHEHRG